ncbi:hypothetical protein VAB77_002547 [Vibrio vulnificus]|nr:hypothetical protein [Vibrio vulnificus]
MSEVKHELDQLTPEEIAKLEALNMTALKLNFITPTVDEILRELDRPDGIIKLIPQREAR